MNLKSHNPLSYVLHRNVFKYSHLELSVAPFLVMRAYLIIRAYPHSVHWSSTYNQTLSRECTY